MIQEKDLPRSYVDAMKELLEEDYDAYIKSLDEKPYVGIRTNLLKLEPEKLKEILDRDFKEIPWVKEGFYFEEERGVLTTPSLSNIEKIKSISKNPYYFAGLYYIQEPSAMTPAMVAGIKPGDKVLDLCAAPGGKSTQAAAHLQGEGLLVSNDFSASRVKALQKNIEVSGIDNVLITNEDPKNLSKVYIEYFDKIIVDAPCSGEGMFRRDSAVFRAYLGRGPEFFTGLQVSILNEAAKMLRPGGTLVYSTCTYSKVEDEGSLSEFLENHPDFKIDKIKPDFGFEESKILPGTIRLFPHKIKGEGHFVARLKKDERALEKDENKTKDKKKRKSLKLPEELLEFLGKIKRYWDYERIFINKDYAYYLPKDALIDKSLHYIRTGLLLGEIKKNRFEPFQALAMNIKFDEWENPLNLSATDERVIKYLKGETIEADDEYMGIRLVCVDGFSLGFVKQNKKSCKNKYYQGWRWM
ncbi:RsmB/NOP family class I SAM-dependent RNA methyltransferase [Lachnoanaerobaculum gingivalis]|uniref:RsmB/NOP family class I SAM-dependent RNA methyltransferase n=1 Tax=Lachnoanaerobaculum gingivalis TaxID=2490855 RepID=UPI0024A6A558|nr:RsmB/NOP family class I SAM-dependent RNA methyltransferase [Lachnoanaerobaculum gingivalis]WHE88194.1 RsmB/NOP family class I SAM-dependent RNA methyltransferase [Lachnoanaerobaculum gingivalis]